MVLAPNPPHGATSTKTRTVIPQGAAVLQSTVPAASDAAPPDGAQRAEPASIHMLAPGAPAACERGCGTSPALPTSAVDYEITVPAGGPRAASARIRVTFDATTAGKVALRASGASVAMRLRFDLPARSLTGAWVSPQRDVLVLELEDPGDCCAEHAAESWVSLDLQRLLGPVVAEANPDAAATGSRAAARVQQWRAGLPAGWQVDVRTVGGFTVAQASAASAPMGSAAPSCADDDGTWSKAHRTLVATDAGQAELPGVVVGQAVDLDADGRQDLLVAYESVCQRSEPDAQMPSGDFAVALDKADGVVVRPHAPIGASAPEALWNVSIQQQGRSKVIRAAGMKSGERPTPSGEMYEFKWRAGQIVLARRYPGAG